MSGANTEPFGIYIHWPFCAQKCPYCDFNSHVRHSGWDEARFLAAYKRELEQVSGIGCQVSIQDSKSVRGLPRTHHLAPDTRYLTPDPRTVTSIFFGGGTPSLMKPETTAAVLEHIAKLWTIAPDVEITLEANPGSVDAGRFAGYRAAGVNRVSMGLQSLSDDQLKKLGRIHTVAESKTALEIARRTFERFSFDLIYARPGQTPADWRAELTEALELAGDHVSLYQLTIEPDTPYAALHAAGKLVVPDADAALALYEITQELTERHGLRAYEISNHARPGEESRHNLLYWRYGEYAGVGPGAHGRIIGNGKRVATVTEKNPETWCARVERDGHGFTETTELSPSEQADEALLMGLRLSEGIAIARLATLGGHVPAQKTLDGLAELGLIEICNLHDDLQDDRAAFAGGKNELDPIATCIGPGLAPGLAPSSVWPASMAIRATPRGRYVLNAVVAEISKSFVTISA